MLPQSKRLLMATGQYRPVVPGLSLDANFARALTPSYIGSPEGLFTSAIAPKYLFNASNTLAIQNYLFRTQTLSSTLSTPDATGGDVGHGFTCTGLAWDGTNYIVGNDGGNKESDPSAHTCGIVKMSPAGVKISEINMRSLYGLGGAATVQGVAVDPTDGTYWAAMEASGVKHVSTAGAALSGSFVPASGNANGLAIDSSRDLILVMAPVAPNHAQIDIYNRADQSFVRSVSITDAVAGNDGLFYDAQRDYVWLSYGANGASGYANAYQAADLASGTATLVGTAAFPSCTSMEGMIIKDDQFVFCNDGYYHGFGSGGNGVNQLQFYPAALGKANVNWPLEYDPVSHSLIGYRFETAFTRGNAYPIDAENWSAVNVTVTANNATSPTGASDANTITASAGTAIHEVTQGSSVAASIGDKIVASDMLQAGTWRYVWIGDRGDSVVHSATYDLQTGTVVGSSNCTASIKDIGGGFYRCTKTYTRSAAGTVGSNIAFSNSSHVTDHASINMAGTETIISYAHEIGVGEYPTSPLIRLVAASTETRAADTASLATSSFGFSATLNTFVVHGRTARGISASTKQVAFQIDDGSENNRYRLERDTSKHLRFIVTSSGVEQCNLDLGVVNDETDFKVAIRATANDFSASLNGAANVTDAAGSLPTVTTLRPGMSFTGEQWGGWLGRLDISSDGKGDAELAQLST
jgi:hypothetical protein